MKRKKVKRDKTGKILLMVLVLAVMAIVPIVSADEKNITINITSPEEGDIIFYDVVPAYLEVQGTIDTPQGIRNVSITNGLTDNYGEVVCGSNLGTHYNISCKILITNHVTITVTDNSGFVVSKTRNFSSYAGPPPPGTIFVYGKVVDIAGNPVSGAVLTFETETRDNRLVSVNTTTDRNGTYSMKKANGFHQKITVRKTGYQTLVQQVTFEPYGHDVDFVLSPQKPSVSGFNFEGSISAILVCFIIIVLRRN